MYSIRILAPFLDYSGGLSSGPTNEAKIFETLYSMLALH